MPRWRSRSSVSVWVVPLSTRPTARMTPVSKRMRSVRLVFPASTCARIPRFRIDVEGAGMQRRVPRSRIIVSFGILVSRRMGLPSVGSKRWS